jgi:hypothetical protein
VETRSVQVAVLQATASYSYHMLHRPLNRHRPQLGVMERGAAVMLTCKVGARRGSG